MVYSNDQLINKIEDTVLETYQDESILALFKGKDVGDIGIEKWNRLYVDDFPDAALTSAGFNPQEAKVNLELSELEILTSAEKLVLDEKQWSMIQKYGVDEEAMAMLGSKIAQKASYFFFRGKATGEPVNDLGNYARSAGAGTLTSPSILSTATAGAWSTYSNKATDLSQLVGQLVAKGYSIGSSIVFYPQAAHATMTVKGNAANDLSAKEYLLNEGFLAVVPVKDEWLYTAAGANPTKDLFDLYAIDLNSIEIGYTRPERVRTILPYGDVRSTSIEAEVWFCPRFIARPYDGGIYKGVSRITAIATS